MRGEALDADFVEQLADFLRFAGGPVEVRAVKLEGLPALLGDDAEGAHQVLFQHVAHGVEFESQGNLFALRGERGGARNSESRADARRQERAAREIRARHSESNISQAGAGRR